MVPPARAAHFDLVPGERATTFRKGIELCRRGHASTERGKPRPEDVEHDDQIGVLADRTPFIDHPTDLGGRTLQLGMGIADLGQIDATVAVRVDQGMSRQAVVDLTGRGS